MPLKLKSSWVMGSLLFRKHIYYAKQWIEIQRFIHTLQFISWLLPNLDNSNIVTWKFIHQCYYLLKKLRVLGIRRCTNEYNSFQKHSCCLALCNSKHSNWIIHAKGIKHEPSQAIFWAILLWFLIQNRTGRLCNLPWLFAGCFHEFSGGFNEETTRSKVRWCLIALHLISQQQIENTLRGLSSENKVQWKTEIKMQIDMNMILKCVILLICNS